MGQTLGLSRVNDNSLVKLMELHSMYNCKREIRSNYISEGVGVGAQFMYIMS